jgi:hypothetical protein
MRTIASELTSAQKGERVLPVVDARFYLRRCGIETPDWVQVALTDDAAQHAATALADGTVVRARLKPADNHLEVAVIAPADRGDADAWVDWTWIASAGGSQAARPALACGATGSMVYLFWRHPTAVDVIRWISSSDGGVTWGAASTAVSLSGATCTGLAATVDGDGDVHLLYTYDPGGPARMTCWRIENMS